MADDPSNTMSFTPFFLLNFLDLFFSFPQSSFSTFVFHFSFLNISHFFFLLSFSHFLSLTRRFNYFLFSLFLNFNSCDPHPSLFYLFSSPGYCSLEAFRDHLYLFSRFYFEFDFQFSTFPHLTNFSNSCTFSIRLCFNYFSLFPSLVFCLG